MFNKEEWITKNIKEKKYHCEKCDKTYRDSFQLNRHLNGKKHNGRKIMYDCHYEGCNYSNRSRFHRDKHLNSRKHS